MSEYKRLTNNDLDEFNSEYDFCIGCEYFGEPNGCNRQGGSCDNYDQFNTLYNRLAELEDKIENGTLVESPCKIGDTIYFDTYRYGKNIGIQPHKVAEVKVVVTTERSFGGVATEIYDWAFGKTVFLTKEEAEKALEERRKEDGTVH